MIHNPFLRLLFVVLLFLSTIPAQAFQVADGTPPAPSTAGKYIFYWGKHQCNLSEAEGYRSTLSLSTAEFRQMLLGAQG